MEKGEGVEWGLEESIKGTKSERGWINRGKLVEAGGGGGKEKKERKRRGHGPPPSQRQDWDCCWQRKASRRQQGERVIEGQEGPQGRSA